MRKVTINFFNNEYSILTDADGGYLEEITEYLEDKVKEMDGDSTSVRVSNPFLLASLKITDDFLRLKKEFEEFKRGAEQKSRDLVELLDSSANKKTNSQTNSDFSGFRTPR